MIPRTVAPLSALAFLCALAACGGSGRTPSSISSVPVGSPPPAGVLSVVPVALPNFTLAGQASTFTVSEPNYSGAFTAAADAATCAPPSGTVATVSPASAPASAATFTVTAGGAPGICSIVVTDLSGQKQTVTVTVSTTQGTLQ